MLELKKRRIKINSKIYAWGVGGNPIEMKYFENFLAEDLEKFGWIRKSHQGSWESLTLYCPQDSENSYVYLHPLEIVVVCTDELWDKMDYLFEKDCWLDKKFGEITEIYSNEIVVSYNDEEQTNYLKGIEETLIKTINDLKAKIGKEDIIKYLLAKRYNNGGCFDEPIYDKNSNYYKYLEKLIEENF